MTLASLVAPEERVMKAREIISSSCRETAVVTFLRRALEIAWLKITDNFGDDEVGAERARNNCARTGGASRNENGVETAPAGTLYK